MNIEDLRIRKLQQYLFEIINTLTTNRNYQINANMLSNEIGEYSMDKVPVNTQIEKWITGTEIHREVYSFKSRKTYAPDTIINLKNIGFFEQFEKIVRENNKKGILPEIEGIENIRCLNCGTMLSNDNGKTAIFEIQIEITYRIN